MPECTHVYAVEVAGIDTRIDATKRQSHDGKAELLSILHNDIIIIYNTNANMIMQEVKAELLSILHQKNNNVSSTSIEREQQIADTQRELEQLRRENDNLRQLADQRLGDAHKLRQHTAGLEQHAALGAQQRSFVGDTKAPLVSVAANDMAVGSVAALKMAAESRVGMEGTTDAIELKRARRRLVELELSVSEKAALLSISEAESDQLRHEVTENVEGFRSKLQQYITETTALLHAADAHDAAVKAPKAKYHHIFSSIRSSIESSVTSHHITVHPVPSMHKHAHLAHHTKPAHHTQCAQHAHQRQHAQHAQSTGLPGGCPHRRDEA